MKNSNTKELLIESTIELLENCNDVSEITARQIAAKANVNLAMINYTFASKDELIHLAIDRLLSDIAKDFFYGVHTDKTPRENLENFLCNFSNITFTYSKFTKTEVTYCLLQDKMTQAKDILPLILAHFDNKKDETYCRVIAYQLISFLQLIFLRSEEFINYSGINILDEEERNKFIKMELDLLLGGK